MKHGIISGVLLCLMVLFWLTIPIVSANPFVSNQQRSENKTSIENSSAKRTTLSRSLYKNRLFDTLIKIQRSFNDRITKTISRYREEGDISLLVYIWLIAVSYGFIHAWMPGHGKNIVFGWILSSGTTFRKVVVTAALSMAMHVFTAILLVYSIWLIIGGRISTQTSLFTKYFSFVAFAILVFIGLKQIIPLFRKSRSSSKNTHHHFHQMDGITEDTSWKECFMMAFSVGLIPCPVSSIIIVFMIAQGFHLEGLLVGLFFALGMAGAMLVFATASWFLRSSLTKIPSKAVHHLTNMFLPVFGSLLLFIAAGIIISPYI